MSYRPYAAIIAEAVAQNAKLSSSLRNDSGSTIAAFQPVCVDAAGKIKAVDVTQDNDAVKILGLAMSSIPDASEGDVISHGRLLNVTLTQSQGDFLYVSKTGGLTNILPEEGVDGFLAGDFVIRVGMVVRNNAVPSNKDVIVDLQIIGRL